VKALLRVVSWLLLTAFAVLWLAACVTGLSLIAGLLWGVLIGAVLAWLRFSWLLQLAVGFGAWSAWRWPMAAAVLLAAPRIVLVLPGLVSSYLANLRHPRARWS
jgi:hypothetical protein